MGAQPDELKTEAEYTRAHLAHNVDRLADKVTPSKVARRKADAAQHRLTGLKERVMGAANDTRDSTSGHLHGIAESTSETAGQAGATVRQTAEQVGASVRATPGQVAQRTQGSPLAAGVIAFGAGMLAAALFPATKAEERLGSRIGEHSDELLQPLKQSAQDIKEEMRQPAAEAAESLKEAARDAVDATAQQARESGQDAAAGLRQTGQEAAQEARDRTGRNTG
ncbi:DUF3618 domain-containing protein [Streptomyces fulvorobeus]|uniref:ElaB/YqjD/DUF883 family membrane-anchored ribosome-binding protein n=1 Tax=Streptomyces fulvorobeus TaxID=284028 RepID=A0A7J0CF32_9ACTN|nr:DUF3618 domain-containing protein [Streptomyces fulvorobeus]NYE44334.1 ElaB/YqjD/DUF883 family membrane-anchored ribosome-binding protein [Streptomyces fulvorobeus]GFN00858.1 hypothetical protein Sfulv_56680 [Streptomyces fulvorobeus]